MDQSVYVGLVVRQAGADLLPIEFGFGGAIESLQALYGLRLFSFGEESGGTWGVGEEEVYDESEEYCGCSLCIWSVRCALADMAPRGITNDEKQPPWLHGILNVRNPISKGRSKAVC